MIKAKHADAGVVCPWCMDREQREFRYPQDLARHVKSSHLSTLSDMPKKTLTTSNMLFFARDPAGYQQIHGVLPDFDSDEAVYAQEQIRRWTKGKIPGYERWKQGWDTVRLDAQHTPRSINRKRKLPALELKQIQLTQEGSQVLFVYDSLLSKATIHGDALQDPSVSSKLISTMMGLPIFSAPSGIRWTKVTQPIIREEISTVLDLQPQLIGNIYISSEDKLFKPDQPVSKPKSPSPSDSHPSSDDTDALSSLVSPTPVYIGEEYDPEFPGMATNFSPEGLPLNYHPIGLDLLLHNHEHDLLQEALEEAELVSPDSHCSTLPVITQSSTLATVSTLPNSDLPLTVTTSSSTPASSSALSLPVLSSTSPFTTASLTPARSSTLSVPVSTSSFAATSLTPAVSSTLSVPALSSPVSATSETPASSSVPVLSFTLPATASSLITTPVPDTSLTSPAPPETASSETTHTQSTLTEPDSSALNSSLTETTTSPSESTTTSTLATLSERAKNLLKTGSLPLLPPGRREWGSVPDQSIMLTPTVSWPPKGWKNMSSEMKLFAVEWAAINLDPEWTGKTRSETILSFNHLVLPGTTLARDSLEVDLMIANYSVVRRIAESTQQRSSDERIVKALEGGEHGLFTRDLSVPLRLQAET